MWLTDLIGDGLVVGRTFSAEPEPTTLITITPRGPEGLSIRPGGLGSGLLAQLLAHSLDLQLADGRSPESSWLLAARAQSLSSPSSCRQLAIHWENLIVFARRAPRGLSSRAPVCRDRLLVSEPEIRELVATLVMPRPIGARGVAMAHLLLTDGSGPVFSRNSAVDLHSALRQATAQLDPSTALVTLT